jgi:O-antigen ligase/tetratricopeptide (TPR) repeat protein
MKHEIYKKILLYLTIACLLTPLFVDARTYFPFIVGKATVFRLLVEIMAIIWVLMIIKGETKLKLNNLSKAFLVYALVILISAFLGVNFTWSFFSGFERMEGVLGIWHFILFFFIIASVFDLNDFKKILKIEVGISVLYGFLALFIYSGGRIGVVSATPRLSGFTGNPSYLGTYFIFNSLLALYFYLESFMSLRAKRSNLNDNKITSSIASLFPRNDSVWWLLIFIFEALLIFISGTRGGMIGFGLGVLYLMGSLIFSKKAKDYYLLKKFSLFILIAGIIFIGLTFALKNTSLVKNNFALERLTSISLKDPTGMARILSAGTAFRSFLEKPLFGWGPENYEAAYITNFNPQVIKVLPGDFYFDRAHNKPMEVLATTGILGFLSYLAIFFFVFKILEKQKRDKGLFLTALTFEAILIGYFVQNIFLFDFHESYLMFFLVLGFISIMGNHSETSSEIPRFARNDSSSKDFTPELLKGFILIVSFCLIFYSLTQFVIKPYSTSKNIISTIRALAKQDNEKASQLLRQTLNNAGFFKEDVIIGVKKGYSSYTVTSEASKPFIESLLLETTNLLNREPWNYRLLMDKAELEMFASSWDKDKIKEAEKTSQDLVKLAPYFPQTHLLLSKIYFLENDLEKAKEEAEKVIAIYPQDPTAYYILGLYYSNKKDDENANKYFIQAAKFGYPFKDKNMILQIANLLAQEKDYETIAKLYLQAISLDSKDAELYVHLAAAYGKMQNKEKAILYAQKAAELNPDLKQASEEFIKLIENEEWDKIPG